MVPCSIRSIRSLRNSDSGFTLFELLVTSVIGLVLMGLCLSAMNANRWVFGKDTVRTRLNQNLRGALDIITIDGKVAGENLTSAFPAIELVNGSGAGADELYLRRNLVDEILPLCTAITAGTTTTRIYFADSSTTPGCAYSGQTTAFNSWKSYRTANGGTVDAYIYNTVNKRGEFFRYSGETNGTTNYSLTRTAGTWTYGYAVGSTAIYLLEEWDYKVVGQMLTLIENRDPARNYGVSFNITNMQVQITMQDGTVNTAFTAANNWTQIANIAITLSGQDQFAGTTLNRSVTAYFFPRNVLSN